MQEVRLVFAGSVTFLGCWFVHAARTNRDLRIAVQDPLCGRVGVLTCGIIDLVIAAALLARGLGIINGLLAWLITGLASWTLIEFITALAPKAATATMVFAVVSMVVSGWNAWGS
ncbi:hypothetical protein [Singulisphaera sp. PoT]|uniref:hypothetical protein n=1 Tax=Singulisphaera sp. PoT TaxID=3411797 RepID=UPI003BF5E624